MWLILVVGIDVAHVYSSLYRTYFAQRIPPQLKKILLWVPILCFGGAWMLATKSTSFFWSVLVYVAVFHFSRQQIGFLRLFTEPQNRNSKLYLFNEISIYVATLGSIFIWHLQGSKSFHWFVKGDFFYLDQFSFLEPYLKSLVFGWSLLSALVNIYGLVQKKISLQAALLVFSTFISWFIPIAILNSDFIFTFANVISHGVPYLALVYSREKKEKSIFSSLEIFLPILLFLAFIEEAFWDSLVWREHNLFFESFYFLPQLQGESVLKAFFLAILISPQLIHYILDGFIWKKKYSAASI